MTLPPWREEAIARKHNRKSFDCGQADLNTFLAHDARQAHLSRSAKTDCAVGTGAGTTILGFYSVSPGHVELHASRTKHALQAAVAMPSAASASVGWRSQESITAGLGRRLLALAAERCMRASAEVGGTALLIDAKDEAGAVWYGLHGAVRLLDRPLSLVLLYATVAQARKAADLPPL